MYATEAESINIRQNYRNFREEGVAFYAYQQSMGIGENIYRFQNTQVPGSYVFVGEGERQSILANYPNFVEEGIAFKVSI